MGEAGLREPSSRSARFAAQVAAVKNSLGNLEDTQLRAEDGAARRFSGLEERFSTVESRYRALEDQSRAWKERVLLSKTGSGISLTTTISSQSGCVPLKGPGFLPAPVTRES